MIQINLLPNQKQSYRSFFISALLLSSIILLVYLSLVVLEQRIEGKLHEFRAGASSIEGELLDGFNLTMPGEGQDVEKRSLQLQKDLQELENKLVLLDQGEWQIPLILEELSVQLPEEVWLTGIDYQKEGQILIQGQSSLYSLILQWLEVLARTPGLTSVQPIDLKAEGVNEFKVRIEVGEKK